MLYYSEDILFNLPTKDLLAFAETKVPFLLMVGKFE